jgi:hypothetical protein
VADAVGGVGIVTLVLVGRGMVLHAQESSLFLPVVAAQGGGGEEEPPTDEQRAINLLAVHEPVADFLTDNPGWVAHAYPTSKGSDTWRVDLYTATQEVVSFFVARELTPEEFQAGCAKVEAYPAYDPEVLARQGNPDLWYHDTGWNRWEQKFESWYSRGIAAFVVRTYIDENDQKVYLDQIFNPNVLDEKQGAERKRNQAVELAWSAPGIDEALADVDNWTTYVEHQQDQRWSVAFVSAGKELFFALVDIEQWIVIESAP